MTIRDITLRDELRTGHVRRWHMVRVLREQTLAEHMYRVTICSQHIYRALCQQNGEFSDLIYNQITQWALAHDKPEVVNGDAPTPVKERIRQLGLSILEDLDQEASPSYMAHYRGVKGSLTWMVVKLADLIEAVAFLEDEGHGKHSEMVRRSIVKRFDEYMAQARIKTEWKRYDWDAVDQVAFNAVHGEEFSL